MGERISHLMQKLKEFGARLSTKAKMLIASGVLLAIFVGAGAYFLLGNTGYEVLFTGLTESEVTEISGKLQEYAVEMKIGPNGTILVPENVEAATKAKLVSEGYPKSGFTYDLYRSNSGIMTTESQNKFYRLADLQERIASTIRLLDGVKDAKVTIALADDKRYMLEQQKDKNTASVIMIMKDGGSPSAEQVRGVQNLVARSIPGVEIEKVAVIDGNGRDCSQTENIQSSASALKMQLEREIEDDVAYKLMHLLTPVYGEDKVRVAVKTQVDIDKKIKEIINYVPNEQNKGAMVKEETSSMGAPDGGGAAGVPGTDTNADIPTYEGVTTNGSQLIFRDDSAYEYLVSQVKEQVQSDAGTLMDTTVSITIDTTDLPANKKAELKRLVANAAGIPVADADTKVEILSTPFAKTEDEKPPTQPLSFLDSLSTPVLIAIIGGLFALLLIILVVVLTIKGKKKKSHEDEYMQRLEEAIPGTVGEDDGIPSIEEMRQQNLQKIEDLKISTIKETREMQVQTEIANFTQANPEIAAQLIKRWIRGGGEEDE